MELVMAFVYKFSIVMAILLVALWIFETIYFRVTKHKDYPSRYVNEIFYDNINDGQK